MSDPQPVRGFAPGVDVASSTFTCPKCHRSRDCQAVNPRCLACGYQDPRSFELPADDYEVAASLDGPWQKLR